MSQPFYYKRNEDWNAWYNAYRLFLDNMQLFLRGRGVSFEETNDLISPVIGAMEGPDSLICEKVMSLLTPEEKQLRNAFNNDPVDF